MDRKKIVYPAFILLALVQLYVPAKMILDREDVLETGTEYRFRTAPVDPSDPFRGKYITMSFEENTVKVRNEEDWLPGETLYVLLMTDNEGFARITSVSKEKPAGSQDFLKTRVRFVSGDGSNRLTIDYPFDRYYMEESKARDAEQAYWQSRRDTSSTTYALVRIKNGDAVLEDVMIDGIPIRETVKARRENGK